MSPRFFIEVTLNDGSRVVINVDHIALVEDTGEGADIYFGALVYGDQVPVRVKESYKLILLALGVTR
jgi:hypothetical protein